MTDPVNPHQAASAAAFVYDDKLIVMGGSTYRIENGWQKYSDKIHMLDLKEGVWYEAGKMPLGWKQTGFLWDILFFYSEDIDKGLYQIYLLMI